MSVKRVAQYDLPRVSGMPFVRANIYTPKGLVVITGDIFSVRAEYAKHYNTVSHGVVFIHRSVKVPVYRDIRNLDDLKWETHKYVENYVTLFFPDGQKVVHQSYRLDLVGKRRTGFDNLDEIGQRRQTWVLYERVYPERYSRCQARVIKTFRRLPSRHIRELSSLEL